MTLSFLSPRKLLGAGIALAGLLSILLGGSQAEATIGQHHGLVGTRGIVLEDNGHGEDVAIWAEYAPDQYIEAPDGKKYLVPGKPTRLHPAVDEYKDAVVLTRDEYVFHQQAYAALRDEGLEHFSLLRSDEYEQAIFHDRLGATVRKPVLRSGTTHVAVRPAEFLEPHDPLVLHEFPLNPAAAPVIEVTAPGQTPSDGLLTFLISVNRSQLGQVLKASTGVLNYLSDYITPVGNEEPHYFGFCRQTPESSVVLNGTQYTTWDDFYRFEACDPSLIKNIWGPIEGAYIDCGARLTTEPGAMTDLHGGYELYYEYIPRHNFWDTLYVSMNFAPFDVRVPFGSRHFVRRKVQAGAWLELNPGAINAAVASGSSIAPTFFQSDLLLSQSDVVMDTARPRATNVGIEVAYMVGQAVLVNRKRPGIDMDAVTTIRFDDSEEPPPQTTYQYTRPAYAPRVDRQYTLSDQQKLVPVQAGAGGGPPVVTRVEPEHSEADEPVFNNNDGALNPGEAERADEIIDRGLLEKISREDISNTDYFVFSPDGILIGSRTGLRANETAGLVCVNKTGLPFGASPTCEVLEGGGAAGFNIQDFVWNRYPGARFRVLILNRVTGYSATGFAKVGAVSLTESALNAVTIEPEIPAPGSPNFIELLPPNLSVKVERLRAPDRGTLTDLGSDAPNVIGFEGAGLTTDEYIAITTEWTSWDGMPLPEGFPGLTGRIARVTTGTTLAPVGQSTQAGTTASAPPLGHFEIKPGKHTQFVRLQDPESLHYYIHVSGQAPETCTHGCVDFRSVADDGALRYRPRHYVPFKVPVFDEAATRSALLTEVALARERANDPGGHQVVQAVPPVYAWVYRPEYQFSVYELPELSDSELVTRYDPEKGRGVTTFTFDYDLLTRDGTEPLPAFGPGQTPIISVGYDELLATVNAGRTTAAFQDLESGAKLTPAGQLGRVESVVGALTPADYLGLQVYLDSDRGNALYQDYGLGFPLVVTDVHPIVLNHSQNVSAFGSEVAALPYVDDYDPIAFTLTHAATVRVYLSQLDGIPLSDVIPPERLDVGKHYVVIDAGRLREITALPNFRLNLEATPSEPIPGATTGATTLSRTPHRVEFPVAIHDERSSRRPGEIIEQDVNLVDGSLTLSRQDFALPGKGPALAMQRTYSNLGGSSDGVLGQGWAHSYQLVLVPRATEQYSSASVPDWVAAVRGHFVKPERVEELVEQYLYSPNAPGLTAVEVNGTTFRLVNGVWRHELGRHGKLERVAPACDSSPESPPGCFVFTAPDGTEYRYPVPVGRAATRPSVGDEPTSLSLSDGLATRLGVGLNGELALGAASVTPGERGSEPLPTPIRSITDRFGNTSHFHYDGEGHLDVATDASGRTCNFSYGAGTNTCPHEYSEKNRLRSVSCLELTVSYCYDEHGNLEQVERGRRIETYGYAPELPGDPDNYNLVSTRSAEGHLHEYRYMTPGLPLSVGLESGPVSRYEVVESIEYPPTMLESGAEVRANVVFGYTGNERTVGDMLPTANPGAPFKRYTLNAHGNPVRVIEPRGKETQFFWTIDETTPLPTDNLLRRRRVTQRPGVFLETEFEYDADGNVTVERAPGGRVTTGSFNEFGQPLTRTDYRGIHESWTYDDRGFLLTHTDGVGNTTRYEDGAGPERDGLVSSESVNGATPARVVEYQYDEHGNLESAEIRGVANSKRITHHDARGRVAFETDPRGRTTSYDYSVNDEVELITLPALEDGAAGTRELHFHYDADGNKTYESDRNGVTVEYDYTGRAQVRTVTRAGADSREYRYDLRGNLRSETDWAGLVTRYGYDDLGFRETTTNRLGAVMTSHHDLVGNILDTTDFAGLVTHYFFDELNREHHHYSDCDDDNCGEVTTDYLEPSGVAGEAYRVNIRNERGYTTSLGYDARGLLVRRVDAKGNTATSQFDKYGRLLETKDEEGFVTKHEYDARGFMRATVHKGKGDSSGFRTEFDYDPNGNVVKERRQRRQGDDSTLEEVQIFYDAWNRPTERIDPAGNSEHFAYDGEGNKIEHVDPAGRRRTWQRNPLGQVLSYTDAETRARPSEANNACGATICLEQYDPNGHAHRVVDVRGNATSFAFDAEERVSSVTEALGTGVERTLEVPERDAMGNPTVVKDGNGNPLRFGYTKRHLLKTETDALAQSTTYTYTATGQIETVRTPRSFTRSFEYDVLDRVDTVRYPGTLIEAKNAYDNVGNPKTVRDRFGSITESSYDDFLRVTSVRKYHVSGSGADVVIQRNVYDDLGNIVEVIDANENHTRHEFDNRNLRVRTIYPGEEPEAQRTEQRHYDAVGNLLSASAPSRADEPGFDVVNTYDRENRLLSSTTPGDAGGALETVSYGYDLAGNRTRETRPEGQPGGRHAGKSKAFVYDALNRLQSVTDEAALATRYEYDHNDNVRHVRGPGQEHTEYTYDAVNRTTSQRQELEDRVLVSSFSSYDGHGNLTELVDPMGRTFSYEYDEYDRRTRTTYPNVPTPFNRPVSTAIGYDDAQRRVTIAQNKLGATGDAFTDVSVEEYDRVFGRLERCTSRGTPVSYRYDDVGNRTEVTSPSGTTTYDYDSRNRLKLAHVGSATTNYEYFPDGRVQRVTLGNGTSRLVDYFTSRRARAIHHQSGGADTASVAYEYDRNGNTRVEDQNLGGAADHSEFDYDAADRLVNFTQDGKVTHYEYENYNRKLETVQQGATLLKRRSYEYDPADRLKRVVDDSAQPFAVTYQYDDNGNTIVRELSNDPGARMDFAYDSRNQLVQSARGPPSAKEILGRYDYDDSGLRIRHLDGGRGDVDAVYDGGALLEERANLGGTLTTSRYHYGDQLLARVAGGATEYYHQDQQGTTQQLTSEVGAVRDTYKHDPFGNVRAHTGTSDSRITYTGQEYDDRTGLYYYGARFYDPVIGRFLTQDSVLGSLDTPPSLHRYLYAYSNPGRFVDPTGHFVYDRLENALGEAHEFLRDQAAWLKNLSTEVCDSEGGFCASMVNHVEVGASMTIGVAMAATSALEFSVKVADYAASVEVAAVGAFYQNEVTDLAAQSLIDETDKISNVAAVVAKLPAALVSFNAWADAGEAIVNKTTAVFSGDTGAIADVTEIGAGFALGGGKEIVEGVGSLAARAARGAESLASGVQVISKTAQAGLKTVARITTEMRGARAVVSETLAEAGKDATTVAARAARAEESNLVTLYHGSVDNFSKISREGLDAARGSTWVTTDLAAAENAIGPSRVLSAGQGVDKGIVKSVVSRAKFEALQEAGAISKMRTWPGFDGGKQLTEHVLRGEDAFELFNAGIQRGSGGSGAARGAGAITKGEQVTEQVIREAMKDAPLASQQAGGVSLPKIQGFVDDLLAGRTAPPIKVDGGMIVDGNHRYIAGRILGQEPAIQPWLGGRPGSAVPWSQLPIDPKAWP